MTILSIAFVILAGIYLKLISLQEVNYYSSPVYQVQIIKTNSTADFIPQQALEDKLQEVKDSRIADLQAQIRQQKIDRINQVLAFYHSPMQGYGELIYNRAGECGGDYRVILGIAGNESGFGRIPLKTYNPFGYLDGVQYSGWNDSLNYLTCVISQRFLKPCNNDLRCIINTYGGPDTPKDLWIKNVNYFISLF